ncbi:MAG: hypothetical protein J0L91_11090 [Burkholderiales bacterium]|nr:hypothetical protein [Burkholderiales bacterium]
MSIERVKLGYANLHVMDRSDGRRVAGGVSAVVAHCGCGRSFTARASGPDELGRFEQVIGGVSVTCPACGHSETFTNQALGEVAG